MPSLKRWKSGYGRVQEFLADTHLSLSSEQLTPHLYWHAGDRAIGHLFRVASSLDSMIIGESQILGQIKDAFEVALTHKASGLLLNKIVKKAISVAKRVRTETKIAETAVSVSYAAVELAKKIFSNLTEKTVLLIGAGEMAKLAARHLIANGVRQVRMTTRNFQHGVELANGSTAPPCRLRTIKTELAGADIVLVSTGASHYLVSGRRCAARDEAADEPSDVFDRHFRAAQYRSGGAAVDNAFLFDIDDLHMRVEQNRGERLREAAKAEQMVVEEVAVSWAVAAITWK